jgi:two-component system OmpR family response regulator
MSRILVIEDDRTTSAEIAATLQGAGHETIEVADGAQALDLALRESFDAATLDRMLPGLDGLSLVAALRERHQTLPVLMLSALSDVDERIEGLRAGGDDYLVKPFVPEEMLARVEVLLRRGAGSPDKATIQIGEIAIDRIARRVTVDGEPVRLLHMEFRLLDFLASHAGETLSRRIIFERVWGYYFDPGANLINVHVARLRKKLDRPGRPSRIMTIKGEGYRLDAG